MTKMQQGRILKATRNLIVCLILVAGGAEAGSPCPQDREGLCGGPASAGDLGASRTEDGTWHQVPREAIYETGDTWQVGTERYRLYGVQACLRNTSYTGADGRKRDCGNASLSMLTGLIRALSPSCAPVARRPDVATAFVVCYADTMSSGGRQRIDLGTALIASGFAFAALDASGRAVNPNYVVAETGAKTARVGLWASPDLPHPNIVLLKAVSEPSKVKP